MSRSVQTLHLGKGVPPRSNDQPPTYQSAQGTLPGSKGWCAWACGHWGGGKGRRAHGASFLSDHERGKTDRWSQRQKDRNTKRQGPRQIGAGREGDRETCRQAGGGGCGVRLGLGHLCGVSEWGAQVGEAGGCAGTWRTWATSWFSPSLSWARLSLRALSLDKESRRDASSALSLVMDSSSSTRPASACRVGTRAAKDIQARREGERKGETGSD